MKYIFLVTFVIFTTMHLYASYKRIDSIRNFSKGFILFSLLAYYIIALENPSWIIIFAIITSWLGDLFLIPKGVKWFTIGGIFFWISHFLFILGYIEDTIDLSVVPIYVYIISALVFSVVVILNFKTLKPHLPKPLFIPMFLYLLTNGGMNCFAIYRMISNWDLGSILTAIGALGFFISDNVLFHVRFNKQSKVTGHFIPMITYSLGELLMVLGLVI